MAEKVQSVEPNVVDLMTDWLKSYKLNYKLQQEKLNNEIDTALAEYYSKSGGRGGNRPDAKLLIEYGGKNYPILIECKGYKDKLVKLDSLGQVQNQNDKQQPHYQNIKNFAVNGAIHYANAILHYTSYAEVFAIGITGWKDAGGNLRHAVGVYYVAQGNFALGQKVGEFSDLSFLREENFPAFLEQVKNLSLTDEERTHLREIREEEIRASLMKLNNDIYTNEKGLDEKDRIYLVVASIMATLGTHPLEKKDLQSLEEAENTDGDIIMRKVKNFLKERKLPLDKQKSIANTIENTVMNVNKVENGETRLKRVFSKIIDDLGIYYKIGLSTDFTGMLFNEMYNWLGYGEDKKNDVVLTPPYVARLLVRLARTNRKSFVYDNAAGSAGLLVAAMNEMLKDARKNITSADELRQAEIKIRAEQLLGVEILGEIYMLAVLNMILMGDGSSKILNTDSLKSYPGKENFSPTVFVLNPPYSAPGNGMIFVQDALSKMTQGYAAIIIQNSAGSGKAVEFNKNILKHSTLEASIKMPLDLFIGKSSVQTNVYVFKVGEPHHPKSLVKFIDFSNDGYTRTNRKKARVNLKDTDHAQERYDELVNVVKFGDKYLNFLKENYYEGTIDPESGADWNQSAPIDRRPTLPDFQKTVADYLAFEVSNILKNNSGDCLGKSNAPLQNKLNQTEWGEFRIGDLFEVRGNPQLNMDSFVFSDEAEYPYFTRTERNNGIAGYVKYFDEKHKISGGCLAVGMIAMRFFYMEKDFYAGQFTKRAIPKNFTLTPRLAQFFISVLNTKQSVFQNKLVRDFEPTFRETKFFLPTKNGEIDFDFMENFIAELEAERIAELEAERIAELEAYLLAAGLKDTKLTAEEEKALTQKIHWSEFKIGDLFEKIHTNKLPYKAKELPTYPEGENVLPCLTSSFNNQGLNYFVPRKEATILKNVISIPSNSDVYRAYYQANDFTVLSDAYAIRSIKELSAKQYLFIVSSINKVTDLRIYSYKNKLGGWNIVRNKKILLPTKNGEIDFEFMEKFIRGLEKKIIRGVVEFNDKKLAALKKIRNS